MKVCWLQGFILVLLVSLSPLTAQAMPTAMAMPDHSMSSVCYSTPAPESCCVDCDHLATLGVCSLFCVSHSGLTDGSACIQVSEVGDSLLPSANDWAHRTIPPDPHPPKAAVII